jgi:hypothetical protein
MHYPKDSKISSLSTVQSVMELWQCQWHEEAGHRGKRKVTVGPLVGDKFIQAQMTCKSSGLGVVGGVEGNCMPVVGLSDSGSVWLEC